MIHHFRLLRQTSDIWRGSSRRTIRKRREGDSSRNDSIGGDGGVRGGRGTATTGRITGLKKKISEAEGGEEAGAGVGKGDEGVCCRDDEVEEDEVEKETRKEIDQTDQ